MKYITKDLAKKWVLTLVLVLVLAGLGIYSFSQDGRGSKIDYASNVDTVAVTVNGQDLTLRNLAFYVFYEETQVEKQAMVYNPEDPNRYWNTRTDHTYIRTAARNAALQMGIHDEIFYQMAMEEGIELREDERNLYETRLYDTWADLTEDGKESMMGIAYEDIAETMLRMTYAQKMQDIYAELHNVPYETYDFSTDAYRSFLKTVDYKVVGDVWSRVDFGNVTIDR